MLVGLSRRYHASGLRLPAMVAAVSGVAAAASGNAGDLVWVEMAVPPSLEQEGLKTVRLYATPPESGARLVLAGSGPAAVSDPPVASLGFTAPVWNHPLGSDEATPGAAFIDPALPFDTFVMLGEINNAPVSFIGGTAGGAGYRVTWDSGINIVWYTLAAGSGLVDPGVFGDAQRRFAVMQVTLPRAGDAGGEIALGWVLAQGGSVSETLTVPPMPTPTPDADDDDGDSDGGDDDPQPDGGGGGDDGGGGGDSGGGNGGDGSGGGGDGGDGGGGSGGDDGGGPAQVSADLDGNGAVDAGDIFEMLGVWGTDGADLDGDGVTAAGDLGLLFKAKGIDRDALTNADWRSSVTDVYASEVLPELRRMARLERSRIASAFFSVLRLEELPDVSIGTPPPPPSGDSDSDQDPGDGGGGDSGGPTPSPSPGGPDVTGDGFVSAEDVAAVLGSFGRDPGGDVTGDGLTRRDDLAEVFTAIGLDPSDLSARAWTDAVMPLYVQELRDLIDRLPKNARRRAPGLIFGLVD